MSPGQKGLGARFGVDRVYAAIVLAIAAGFYFWTATSAGSPATAGLQSDDLYNRLADGFLSGQLGFVEVPNPAIAQLDDPWDPAQNGPLRQFHDVSYFEGRYYLYFGAPPAFLLLAPWKFLTGTYLAQNIAVAVFAWLGALGAVAAILAIRVRWFPTTPAWVTGLCCVVAAFGNFVPVLLRRPVYYELAVASAYAFTMAALFALVKVAAGASRRRFWLATAAGLYGLAIASRPSLLFGAVVLAVPLLPALREWRSGAAVGRAALLRDVVALAAPLALTIGAILAYNQARFGNPFEFGTSYMFSGVHPQRDVVTTFRFLPANLWFYLLAPAHLIAHFPFVDVIGIPWFRYPAGFTGVENVYGLFPNLPFFWMIVAAVPLLRLRTAPDARLRDLLLGMLVLSAINLLFLMRVGGAANRYMVDWIPVLVPIACAGVFHAEQRLLPGARRSLARAVWMSALAITIAVNLFVSLQHNDLLKFHNPAAYSRLAHAFNRVPHLLGLDSADLVGPVRVRLTFPEGRQGGADPLIVTGHSFRADFLYVVYTDARRIQIGFEHTSYGGPVTAPLTIDRTAEHELEVEMGSFYPPREHPFFDGMDAAEVERLKRTFRVRLDGREILSGTYDFYDSSPGDVSVGRNPVSDAFGRRFTGNVLEVERTGMFEPGGP